MDISGEKKKKNITSENWTRLWKGNYQKQHKTTSKPNFMWVKIDNTQQNSKCRLYYDGDETINHIINEYSTREYKIRHNLVGNGIVQKNEIWPFTR